MAQPADFAFTQRKNGEVVITHRGRRATILRGRVARDFLTQVERRDPQEVMARLTGNDKRGNER